MKTLLSLLLIGVLISCNKSVDQSAVSNNNKPFIAEVTIKAEEQHAVSRYEIETSTNGRDYTTAGVVFADDKPTTQYFIKLELKDHNIEYFRVKAIDIDNKYQYSEIITR